MYIVVFENRQVEKQFYGLEKTEQQQIKDALEPLRKDPFHSEKLSGDLTRHWSLHIKDLRVIYRVEGTQIVIRAVGHHNIYEEFSRYLRMIEK